MKVADLSMLARYAGILALQHPRVRILQLTLELWQLNAAFDHVTRRTPDREKETADQREMRLTGEWFEREMITDQIDSLRTGMLIRKAERLGLDIQSSPEDWYESRTMGTRSFTRPKVAEVSKAIRIAEGERWIAREARLKVLGTLLAGISGVAGTLIGLIAIAHK